MIKHTSIVPIFLIDLIIRRAETISLIISYVSLRVQQKQVDLPSSFGIVSNSVVAIK
jgi:hypothetical protein